MSALDWLQHKKSHIDIDFEWQIKSNFGNLPISNNQKEHWLNFHSITMNVIQ